MRAFEPSSIEPNRRALAELHGAIPGRIGRTAPAVRPRSGVRRESAEVSGVLVDTSVWIDHFRGGSSGEPLIVLLEENAVRCHPAVVGEIAMGNLSGQREGTLERLDRLPRAKVVVDEAVRSLIETESLWGRGIGWTDAHLLSSAIASQLRFWTLDRRLRVVGGELGLAWPQPSRSNPT